MAVPPTSPKAELRFELKQRRQAFAASVNIHHLSSKMSTLAAPRIAGRVVAAYIALADEMDPAPLVEHLAAKGATIALPHVSRSHESLRFLRWNVGTPLDRGPYGLSQPPADMPEIEPDVILAPLLGFDRALNRIGYGAGHYDRAFARFPDALRIGLAWSVQICPAIPIDPWDVPLHAVVTETEWIEL